MKVNSFFTKKKGWQFYLYMQFSLGKMAYEVRKVDFLPKKGA